MTPPPRDGLLITLDRSERRHLRGAAQQAHRLPRRGNPDAQSKHRRDHPHQRPPLILATPGRSRPQLQPGQLLVRQSRIRAARTARRQPRPVGSNPHPPPTRTRGCSPCALGRDGRAADRRQRRAPMSAATSAPPAQRGSGSAGHHARRRRCLDVPGGATADGTPTVIRDRNGGANQRWTFAGDGAVVGQSAGPCLDVDRKPTACCGPAPVPPTSAGPGAEQRSGRRLSGPACGRPRASIADRRPGTGPGRAGAARPR